MTYVSDIKDWLGLGQTAILLLKETLPLLPKGKSDELEVAITRASEALSRSDAALAKALGYKLCKCTFPPQPMLWVKSEDAEVCPNCGTKGPPKTPQVNRGQSRLVESRFMRGR